MPVLFLSKGVVRKNIRFFDMFSGIGGFGKGSTGLVVFPVLDIAKSISMQTEVIEQFLTQKESGFVMTQKKYDQKNYQSLISCAEDFRARLFQLLEKDKVLKMPEELYSLKLPDWLKQDDLRIFYLKMYPDCYRITKARRLTPSYIRFMNWGIMWNGKCLTARISESLSPEKECILSDILMKDVPEKYYLSPEQTRRLLFKSSQAARGAEFIPKTD